ncbi:MAG: hypothetical protein Q9184_006784, partial [Pyrenodesmia sp. 2 TL-2023]
MCVQETPSSRPLSLLSSLRLTPSLQLRTLGGFFAHLPFTSRRLLAAQALPRTSLFQPMILTSRAAPLEIDFYMHKSNSTYFADFDIARLHLMVRLCGLGLKTTSEELYVADGRKGPKRITMGMGGVHMNFKREIK